MRDIWRPGDTGLSVARDNGKCWLVASLTAEVVGRMLYGEGCTTLQPGDARSVDAPVAKWIAVCHWRWPSQLSTRNSPRRVGQLGN